jgi:diaminopimelate epimerase
MREIPFIKMHGMGNDFVVLDGRVDSAALTPDEVRRIADRHRGVGCDQFISIEPSERATAFMRVHNADGGEVAACGNAARCVADKIMTELGVDMATLETVAGVLEATRDGNGLVTVDQGPARVDWWEIPLARELDTLHIDMSDGGKSVALLTDAVGVNVGNPHAVFFVDDVQAVDLATIGPELEHHPLFPERANISVAQARGRDAIRVKVWERGVGITSACGTAACAVAVAGARRDLTDRVADIHLDGGTLHIVWRDDGHVLMTGPVSTSFSGVLDDALLNRQTI